METGALSAHTFTHDLGPGAALHSCFSDRVGYLDKVPASNRAPIVQPAQPQRGTCACPVQRYHPDLAAERGPPTFYLEAQLPSPTWPGTHLALSSCQILSALLFVKGRVGELGKQRKLKLTLCSWSWRCYRHYYYIAVLS